jgi:hypothetical protein
VHVSEMMPSVTSVNKNVPCEYAYTFKTEFICEIIAVTCRTDSVIPTAYHNVLCFAFWMTFRT